MKYVGCTQHLILSVSIVLVSIFGQPAQASVVNAYGPTKFSSGFLKPVTKTATFAGNPQGASYLVIQNGNGKDLSAKTCAGSFLQKLVCGFENLARSLEAVLTRPDQIEIQLNGTVIVKTAQLKQTMGSLQIPVTLKASNQLSVKLGTLPTQSLTLTFKMDATVPNVLPIARFSSMPLNPIIGQAVAFDGTLSTDSDGRIVSYFWDFEAGQTGSGILATHAFARSGMYAVKLTVTDDQGGKGILTQNVTVFGDTTAPVLAITSPAEGSTSVLKTINVAGTATEALGSATAQLNGEAVVPLTVGSDLKSFSGSIQTLLSGARTLTIKAKDLAGNEATKVVHFTLDFAQPPIAKLRALTPVSGIAPLMVQFDASQSTNPEGGELSYSVDFGDGTSLATAPTQFTHEFESAGNHTVVLTVKNIQGRTSTAEVQVSATNPVIPMDPVAIAPALPTSKPQSLQDSVSFLYQGANPIQTGMQPNAVDPLRTAILRGQVFDETGNPLSGVKISILEMPQVGQTMSRNDGKFDIVVNGGSTLTVRYERNGYFAVQRKVTTSYRDYFKVEKVVLLRPDSKVVALTTGKNQPQVAKSATTSDSQGERTSVLVLPSGTQASLLMPDGSHKPVNGLSLRMTEYTVGEKGPDRMPGPLPSTTSYTYALEISADEAIANGADHVIFSKPVPFYVDNFLNFPEGTAVPVGSFNRQTGFWEGEADGIVLKVLDVQNGIAQVDVDGSGNPASAEKLSFLSIDAEELTTLAATYSPGKSIWRARFSHLSPYDLNFLSQFIPPIAFGLGPQAGPGTDCGPCVPPVGPSNSVDAQSQAVTKSMDVPGAPFSLHYSSMTKEGRSVERQIIVPLVASVPANLQKVHLTIQAAGQVVEQDFVPSPNLTYAWTWDGKDAYGRPVPNSVNAKVDVEYETTGYYRFSSVDFNAIKLPSSFNNPSSSLTVSTVPTRDLIISKTTHQIPISNDHFTNADDIGGWTPDIVHRYNPISKKLYLGNGTMIDASMVSKIVAAIAGRGTVPGFQGDGGPASLALLNNITKVAVAPDGSIYVADSFNNRIRKISTDGIIQTVVGKGSGTPATVDGIAGTSMSLGNVASMQVSTDGALYFLHQNYLLKMGLDGIVHIVGGGGFPSIGDGGPATSAFIYSPQAIALLQDGSILVSDNGHFLIRKILPNGIITTIAGNGNYNEAGDGGSALQAALGQVNGLAEGLNGEIYVLSTRYVRAIYKDGTINRIAGNGTSTPANEGPALSSGLNSPQGLVVAPDGSIVITDGAGVRSITPDGIIHAVAGGGILDRDIPAAMANQASTAAQGIALYRSDAFVFTDGSRLSLVGPGFPTFSTSGYNIGSVDGSEIYQFSSLGTHLQTLFSKTGKVKWKFSYDADGHLTAIADANGLVTSIQRDGSGKPLSIKGPFSQVSTFEIDGTGFLSSLTSPQGNTTQLQYSSGGMLSSMQLPGRNSESFSYDAAGAVSGFSNAGGSSTITRIPGIGTNYTVKLTSPSGRVTTVDRSAVGISYNQYTYVFPDTSGFTEYRNLGESQQLINYLPGSVVSSKVSLDPRLGGITQIPFRSQYGFNGTDRAVSVQSGYVALDKSDFFKFIETRQILDGESSVLEKYDSTQKKVTSVTSLGRFYSMVHDDLERVISSQNGSLSPQTITYNAIGKISSLTQGDRSTAYAYNPLGQLSSVKNAIGETMQFTWNADGRIASSIATDGSTTKFTYDAGGNMQTLETPTQFIHQFTTNLESLFESYTAPGGGFSLYSYNQERDLIEEKRPSLSKINYTYEAKTGRLTGIQTANKSLRFNYNSSISYAPRPLNYVSSDGIGLRADVNGTRPTLRTYTGNVAGTVGFTYGAQARLSSLSVGSQVVPLSYDKDDNLIGSGDMVYTREPASALITKTQLGAVSTILDYNQFGEVESLNSVSSSLLLSLQFSRDKLGRIISKTEVIGGANVTSTYKYDLRGRLKEVSENGVIVRSYSYDSNGNRTSMNALSGVYNSQDQLILYGGNQYQYTLDGSLSRKTDSSGKATQYFYDDLGQLSKVILPDGKIIEYLIDGEVHRAVKRVNGTVKEKLIYYGATLAAKLAPDNSFQQIFIYDSRGHSPDEMISGGVKYVFIKDQIGSIKLVVNSASAMVVQRIDYDDFGNVIADTNPGFQPFGFAGGLYDPDTKLVRYGARDYDAEVGRFTSKDPIRFNGGDTNLYGYVANDPVNNFDPSGLKTQFLITRGTFGIGNHVAVYIDNGGSPMLFDPGGSYANQGSGDFVTGSQANVGAFSAFHRSQFGDSTEVITFNTSAADEAAIANRIQGPGMGGFRGGQCAAGVSSAVDGIGPFSGLGNNFFFPGSLGNALRGLGGR